MATLSLFDALLALTLAVVAIAALTGTGRFRAIVLFVVFGLLLALAWARLGAVDLALAEAAIGAGITGALFMAALDRLRRCGSAADPPGRGLTAVIIGAVLATATGVPALLALPAASPAPMAASLPATGVTHPVTAVLLAFRAWDTLLEVAVLSAAGLAVSALGPPSAPAQGRAAALQRALLGLVGPFLLVLAVYFLWRGGHGSGGAFQAGALLAAAGIFHHLTHHPGALTHPAPWQGPASAAGLGVFTLAALASIALGEPLRWPAEQSKAWILTVEAAAALSIGTLLTRVFVGGAPSEGASS
ncbi:hydrogenase subunit MbhD domain-containing protein [Arhodomonas sp. SL1]|uniref:hydrogenase subunit MbhD domain-containing protein n=1 Tax=Arhodomonas sp. SL1 TaxID=3425691 RepID=UPI003F881EBA